MRELALYVVAATIYVAVGVAFPEFLLAWPAGAAYLLVAAWLVPAALRRLR